MWLLPPSTRSRKSRGVRAGEIRELGTPMSTPLGDALTRWSIRIALAFAGAALAARIGRRVRIARLFWTAGCLFFLAHVVCAFHFVHSWSHDAAYAATARDTAALFGLD